MCAGVVNEISESMHIMRPSITPMGGCEGKSWRYIYCCKSFLIIYSCTFLLFFHYNNVKKELFQF